MPPAPITPKKALANARILHVGIAIAAPFLALVLEKTPPHLPIATTSTTYAIAGAVAALGLALVLRGTLRLRALARQEEPPTVDQQFAPVVQRVLGAYVVLVAGFFATMSRADFRAYGVAAGLSVAIVVAFFPRRALVARLEPPPPRADHHSPAKPQKKKRARR